MDDIDTLLKEVEDQRKATMDIIRELTHPKPLLEIKIPMLPPSTNSIYAPVSVSPTSSRKGFNTIRMTKEATTWIAQATLFLPPAKLPTDCYYRMESEYRGNWHNKDGTIKRRDVRNLEKLVTDTIFRRYSLDDKLIWESLVCKVQSDKDAVIVKLYKIE